MFLSEDCFISWSPRNCFLLESGGFVTLPPFFFFLDLRKFRTYKGSSVRDLLRAMRNKVRAEGAQRGRAGCCTAPSSYPFPMGALATLE